MPRACLCCDEVLSLYNGDPVCRTHRKEARAKEFRIIRRFGDSFPGSPPDPEELKAFLEDELPQLALDNCHGLIPSRRDQLAQALPPPDRVTLDAMEALTLEGLLEDVFDGRGRRVGVRSTG